MAALLLLAVSALVTLPAAAQSTITCGPLDDGRIADVFYEGNAIYFEPIVRYEYESAVLRISGPCEDITKTFSPKEQIFFDLKEVERVLDGSYKWELRLMPAVDSGVRKELTASRGSGEEDDLWWSYWQKGLIPGGPSVDSAGFTVVRGEIITPSAEEKVLEKAAVSAEGSSKFGSIALATAAAGTPVVDTARHMSLDSEAVEKAHVISGDLVVYNSICVGFDCPTSPTFGADTIRLQENNLRIHVDDTSTSSSFPNQDWRLEFNSNLNGGGEYFRVIDATANRNIMTLEGSAPSHSLYVDNGGRVGMGTSNPVVELHVADGDTPALRLDQNTSSGFAAQVWDIAGNETSFFVRDATNGSTLPFRIFPGSASSSLVVRDSKVGVGTTSPALDFHVSGSGLTFARLENADADARVDLGVNGSGEFAVVAFNDGSGQYINANWQANSWSFRSGPSGNIQGIFQDSAGDVGIGTTTPAGKLDVDGPIFQRGSQIHADYVFEPDYALESIEEHAEFMWSNKHLPAVGARQVDSSGREVVEIGAQRRGMLEELEKAHIYIEQLNAQLKAKNGKLSDLEARLAELESLITATGDGS